MCSHRTVTLPPSLVFLLCRVTAGDAQPAPLPVHWLCHGEASGHLPGLPILGDQPRMLTTGYDSSSLAPPQVFTSSLPVLSTEFYLEETLNTNYFPNCMIYYQMATSIKTILGYILCIK